MVKCLYHHSSRAQLPSQNAKGVYCLEFGQNPEVGTDTSSSQSKGAMRIHTRCFAKGISLAGWFLAVHFTVRAQVNVTTYRNDLARDGQNLEESLLTPSSVTPDQFGKLYMQPVDGYIYAQPLYVSGVQIAGCVFTDGCVHNVVFVATQHDSVYAFDADSNAGVNASPLWHVSFINPAAGITTVSAPNDEHCTDINPEVGITGTPVIDLSTGTLYVVVNTKENGAFFQRLHALDITSGAEKFGGPVVIQATVPGTGAGQAGGQVSFDPLRNGQRPGLLLVNGLIYITWASHCDLGPYHGWMMAYDAHSLQQVAVWNASPNGSDAGVWQSGAAPAADSSGNVFLATGNGTFDLNTSGPDAGDTIAKIGLPGGGTFPILDYFTPYNQAFLSSTDTDLGAGGVMLFPDQPAGAAHQHLAIAGGKQGTLYVVDRDNMGHFNASGDTQIVQSLPSIVGGMFATPAFWNNTLYVGGVNDALQAFSFDGNSGLLSTSPVSSSPETFHYPGTTPSVSADGTTGGLVWALEEDNFPSAVLHVYDATNLSNELYNSSARPQDSPGPSVKFVVPTVANGKVYVGTATQLAVFGLMGSLPAAPTLLSPANGAMNVSQVPLLSWSASSGATSYDVYYGTTSPPPLLGNQTATSYAPPELAGSTMYYWMIIARNAAGTAASPIWSFTTGGPPVAPMLLSPANGAIGIDPAVTFRWAPANGATSYQLYLGTTSPPPQFATTGGTSYGTVTLDASTLYYWSVTAVNVSGQTSSSIWSFNTANCPVSVSPPAVYLDSTSQSASVNVTAFPSCGWLASAMGDFITIISGEGAGNGVTTFSVPANSTGADLTGAVNINSLAVPVTQRETPVTFADIADPSIYYFDAVNIMYQKGITNGCLAAPLEFCPDDINTRGQIAKFIVTAIEGGSNFSYNQTPYFSDVPSTYEFFSYIQKLYELGITNGCATSPSLMFCPDDGVTRDQIAAFIIRARFASIPFSYPATQIFADVPPTDPFFNYVQEMYALGITTGCSTNPLMYCPDWVLTRGQMAVFVVRGLLNLLLPATTPILTSVSPNSAPAGTPVTVTITGLGTNFAEGSSQVLTVPGVSASNVVVNSPTSLTVQIVGAAGVTPNPSPVVVQTGTEQAGIPVGFTVQ